MASSKQFPGVVRFGVFEVDLRAGELRKDGLKVRLQEQPFRVLALLLEKPGEVITREEVREKLWSADTYVGLAPKSETRSLDSKSIEWRMSDEFVSTEIHARVQIGGGGTA